MLPTLAVMVTHEFSVSVHDLDAAGKHFRFAVRPGWVRGALEGTEVSPANSEGELDLRVSKSGTDVVVRGTLRAELVVACARCLEPARVAIREPISALVVPAQPAGAVAPGQDDEATEEADVIVFDGETVVLDDLVRDELLLGIPMIPLCSEACPGIRPETPPESGAVPGVDPRLRPLLRIKKSQT
jgi:uncharacterized protein